MSRRSSAIGFLAAWALTYPTAVRCNPFDRLRAKIEAGGRAKIVVFGDSISAGWQIPA